VPLAGGRLIEWSIAALRGADAIGPIVVACPPGHVHDLGGEDLRVVDGGATRSESVRNALAAVETELVAVHDAARPLVTSELVDDVVATLAADSEADGAIAAAPVTDTVKRVAGEAIESTADRTRLWAAQTPQAFRVGALRKALDAYPDDGPEPTDEAMLIEAAGGRVLICRASPENLKVTTQLDLKLAELLLADRAR
jgi:2-C-methyl-D-erythritol 4-phosphate cytidylyltransferase